MLVIKAISEYLTFLGTRSPKGDIGDNLDNAVKKYTDVRYTVAGRRIERERREEKEKERGV